MDKSFASTSYQPSIINALTSRKSLKDKLNNEQPIINQSGVDELKIIDAKWFDEFF